MTQAGAAPALAETNASGQANAAAGQIAAKLMAPMVLAPALVAACSRQFPDQHVRNAALLDEWRRRNAVDEYEQAAAAFAAAVPPVAKSMVAVAGKGDELARGMLSKNPAPVCAGLRALLAMPQLSYNADTAGGKTAIISHFGAAQVKGRTLFSVGQIGALAIAAQGTGPRKARLEAATAALKRLGPIVISGQVTGKGNGIRTIGPERESVVTLSCYGYAQPEGASVLEAWAGREVLVAGVPDEMWSSGNVRLKDCMFVADAAGLARSTVDEAPGMEWRRPTREEAQGKPGEGIALASVAHVLFKMVTQPRFDGFGNGYMDRSDDTYVLMKDGTAFHHEWDFPFEDLDLPVMRRRMPDNWYRWTEQNGDYVLVPVAGSRSQSTITLNAGTVLRPFPAGATFDRSYKFLGIAAGGLRTDKSYCFRSDGTLTSARSSLVAAQVPGSANEFGVSSGSTTFTSGPMGGFIGSAGKSDRIIERYRIDGYAVTLTRPDGSTERRSIGIPEASATVPPKSLYLGGILLWSD